MTIRGSGLLFWATLYIDRWAAHVERYRSVLKFGTNISLTQFDIL